ncbi:MAG: YihY/virulence factor BrkB family protein [Leptolyngbyaceae cyanobacterium CRU_2_3]|nr:YihY/virulence factor BrkB family protein [Leptolyngbyaceae cyanobacterium CRU_2_3]
MRSLRFFQFFQYLNWQTLWKTVRAAGNQRLPGLAAEMAYNAMLSLFPAILAVLSAIGLFQPLTQTFQTLASQISEVAPAEVLGLIQGFAQDISSSQNSRLFSFSFLLRCGHPREQKETRVLSSLILLNRTPSSSAWR